VSLEEGFARFVGLGEEFASILANPDMGTRADQLGKYIAAFDDYGWRADVGSLTIEAIEYEIVRGGQPIALVTIDSNGIINAEGSTPHWVHVTEIDSVNSRVYFYNPYTNSSQDVSFEVFDGASANTPGNTGTNTVVVAHR